MITELHNNIGICSLAIVATLQGSKSQSLTISKLFFIMPIVAHKQTLSYFANAKTNFSSIEELLAKKYECFINFNDRYYDSLTLTMNSIQFLLDAEFVVLDNSILKLGKNILYENGMGARAKKIFSAVPNIVKFLENDDINMFLNLRIKI